MTPGVIAAILAHPLGKGLGRRKVCLAWIDNVNTPGREYLTMYIYKKAVLDPEPDKYYVRAWNETVEAILTPHENDALARGTRNKI